MIGKKLAIKIAWNTCPFIDTKQEYHNIGNMVGIKFQYDMRDVMERERRGIHETL
jgi:hypothetical protein